MTDRPPVALHPSAASRPVQITLMRIDLLVVRIWRPTDADTAALSRTLGLRWPTTPNTRTCGDIRVLWLGPEEWAVVGMPHGVLVAQFAEVLNDRPHHVADLADGRCAIEVHGPAARDLLSKVCSLDLDSPSFGAHSCAQTLLSQVAVCIEKTALHGDKGGFLIHVDSSVSSWLMAALEEAATEFEVP